MREKKEREKSEEIMINVVGLMEGKITEMKKNGKRQTAHNGKPIKSNRQEKC